MINGHKGKWTTNPQGIIQPNKELELPFKPFTLDEVREITKVSSRVLDQWVKRIGLRHGCGVFGLDYMQMFAVFVGNKYLVEGAPFDRATAVVVYLSGMQLETLLKQFAQGNVIPAPRSLAPDEIPGRGMMVPMPQGNPLVVRLDTRVFLEEFKDSINKMFPR